MENQNQNHSQNKNLNQNRNQNTIYDVIEVKKDRKPAYSICVRDSFADLAACMQQLHTSERRVCIVTDTNVEKLYLQEVRESLMPICRSVCSYVIPAGESNKNLDEIRRLLGFLIEQEFDRSDLLVALGGGVIGDMTGFASAVFLRGISFVQIPTTLLSQVDSSIGGKTGVDFDAYKNMVGAFHQPSLVYLNVAALKTLNDEQFASGMGEVLKHGLIKDAAYYEWCLDHMEEIGERESLTLKEMVVRSVLIKKKIVEKDPEEKGERALLNFGHTAGHAIEKRKEFQMTHGACVALGIIAASYISKKRGLIDENTFYEIRDMMVAFDLPITFDSLEIEDLIETTRKDKKRKGDTIRFILLKKLGNAYIDETVSDDELREALKSILYVEAE